jgi:hypothetical protein
MGMMKTRLPLVLTCLVLVAAAVGTHSARAQEMTVSQAIEYIIQRLAENPVRPPEVDLYGQIKDEHLKSSRVILTPEHTLILENTYNPAWQIAAGRCAASYHSGVVLSPRGDRTRENKKSFNRVDVDQGIIFVTRPGCNLRSGYEEADGGWTTLSTKRIAQIELLEEHKITITSDSKVFYINIPCKDLPCVEREARYEGFKERVGHETQKVFVLTTGPSSRHVEKIKNALIFVITNSQEKQKAQDAKDPF